MCINWTVFNYDMFGSLRLANTPNTDQKKGTNKFAKNLMVIKWNWRLTFTSWQDSIWLWLQIIVKIILCAYFFGYNYFLFNS